jgi:hypothetical protein
VVKYVVESSGGKGPGRIRLTRLTTPEWFGLWYEKNQLMNTSRSTTYSEIRYYYVSNLRLSIDALLSRHTVVATSNPRGVLSRHFLEVQPREISELKL